jgi:hypothetical protein
MQSNTERPSFANVLSKNQADNQGKDERASENPDYPAKNLVNRAEAVPTPAVRTHSCVARHLAFTFKTELERHIPLLMR